MILVKNVGLSYTGTTLNVISLIFSVLVLLIVLVINKTNKKSLDQISTRIGIGISLTDALRSIILLINNAFLIEGVGCTFVAVLFTWINLLYIFLIACITFNLNLVVLFNKGYSNNREKFYWLGALVTSIIIVIPPLISGRFGLDLEYGYCTYRDFFTKETYDWKIGTFIFWVLLVTFYGFITILIVILKLQLPNLFTRGHYFQEKPFLKLRRLIYSNFFYISVPIFTQLGFCFVTINTHFGRYSEFLNYWSVIGLGLSGFLNFIVFMVNPSLLAAFTIFKNRHNLQTSENPNSSPKDSSISSFFVKPFSSKLFDFGDFFSRSTKDQGISSPRLFRKLPHINTNRSFHSPPELNLDDINSSNATFLKKPDSSFHFPPPPNYSPTKSCYLAAKDFRQNMQINYHETIQRPSAIFPSNSQNTSGISHQSQSGILSSLYSAFPQIFSNSRSHRISNFSGLVAPFLNRSAVSTYDSLNSPSTIIPNSSIRSELNSEDMMALLYTDRDAPDLYDYMSKGL